MNNKNSSSGYGIAFIIVLIIAIMISAGGCKKETERNRWGSSIDWGPDHYWDSDTESVERIPWR